MPRRASLHNVFTKGVLDPALSERIDLAHYYSGLESGLNIEPFPQGGWRRRAGTTLGNGVTPPRRLRRRIEPIAMSALTVTAPNGGTAANLKDQSAATALVTDAVDEAAFVIAAIDLGAATAVVFADVIGFSCATGRFPRALVVEYQSGSDWLAFAPDAATARKTLLDSVRTRRFGLPPGETVTARYWRIVAHGAVGAGAVSVKGVRLWAERRALSEVDVLSFARTSDLVYEMVLTDRNIDVFQDHAFVTSIAVDIDRRQIAEVSATQSLDTLLLWHEDIETPRIQRQGAGDEWDSGVVPYTNMPNLDAGTAFAGDQDEIQEIAFVGLLSGQSVVVWLGASCTAPVAYSSTFAADLKTALVAIGVPSDLVVADLAGFTAGVRLTFSGTAGGRRWPVAFAVVIGVDDAEAETRIVQRGLDASGPFVGDATGYPRCGVTYQDRIIIAGFRGAPQSYGVSRYGDVYDFLDNSDPLTADLAFFATLNTDQVETINHIAIDRHLLFYTDAGEWFAEARTIDATQPFNVALATRNGALSSVAPIYADGAILFLQRGGRVLRDQVYSDATLKYQAEPINLLAPHLLTNVVDMAYRPARSIGEGNQVFLINADGTIAFMSLMREQEVVALAPWWTDGQFKAVAADVLYRVWLVVRRETTAGGADLYLEKLDGSHTLDAAVRYAAGGGVTAGVSGLGHVEGEDVWAWADRDLVGPLLVTGGAVTLPVPAAEAVVGLHPPLRARLPRVREKLQNGYQFRPPARIYELELALAGTGQIDIAVNGGPFRDVPLTFLDGVALDIASDPPRGTSGLEAGLPAESLERLIGGLVMIPGSGEFVYGDTVVTRVPDNPALPAVLENAHVDAATHDFVVSLGHARSALPDLGNVALFVTWFGDDLRCGSCEIRPKVDNANDGDTLSWTPYDWSVAGLTRATAEQVSVVSGVPQFGGTPADRGVIEAIQEMRAQGLAVTLTPFLIMDVPAGNALPDPYGGAAQAVYPWRGRITCHPAPGVSGTPDLTTAAATQVAAFVGTVDPADFAVAGETITYLGPSEWSYRRFILHHAALAKAAGGVDTFVIGSEMRGLTWVRDALGSYPFVAALVALAADVKAMLGPDTKVTYAADWSEFPAHQTGVSGEAFFHLDPLWASPNIDAIGIDNYWPLADWRAGDAHLDMQAGWRSIYDRAYLQSNIAGGEGFDWYYASPSARDAQTRTAITDSDYGKPWVWRFKDIKSWWENAHHNRPGGLEAVSPTAWVARSKPIWFMEVGCPAVDKGANQPNVFVDPKSSESFYPYYSTEARDDRMQRAMLEALIGYYTPGQAGFSDARNPPSSVYAGRMVDHRRIYVYCWDARPYPAFPQLRDVWSDGDAWSVGHWITGRVALATDALGDTIPVGVSAELPMRDRLLTGNIRVTNLRGWTRHPTVEFSQSRPAPLELRAIRLEMMTHG